jgi:3-oxoacyl-[acyl-carrier protein] reductase/pyridoxal 4-dehydrogenase
MGKLDNRVAIVTGAAQGIGKAIADKLASEGAVVVAADVNGEGAERAAPAGGAGLQVDVSREDDVERMVEETVSRFGKLDVLVNNAAIVPFTAWDDVTFEEWRRIMSVNLDGVFLTCHYAQEPMRDSGYGRIVNIASNVILAGTPNLAHYVASKGGVFAFTRALAREIGKYGITVNAVAPGLTETEGVLASPHKEAFDFVQALQCIPRRGVAADIAPAVAFLASEEAGWVTGQLLVADAGMTHN